MIGVRSGLAERAPRALDDVRFAAHDGLNLEIAQGPESATGSQHTYLASMAQATKALIDAIFGWLALCTM
jgi:hypothetical protein